MSASVLYHFPFDPGSRAARLARASIDVNCSLAAASAGQAGGLAGAVGALLRLGPALPAYLRQSRIVDRLMPRVRLALSGAM